MPAFHKKPQHLAHCTSAQQQRDSVKLASKQAHHPATQNSQLPSSILSIHKLKLPCGVAAEGRSCNAQLDSIHRELRNGNSPSGVQPTPGPEPACRRHDGVHMDSLRDWQGSARQGAEGSRSCDERSRRHCAAPRRVPPMCQLFSAQPAAPSHTNPLVGE
jgi:hypothetical protein